MSNSATAELIRMPEMQRIVDGIVQCHQTCDKESNALLAQPVKRNQCIFDPMNYFALRPRLQPPMGQVLDWLYVGDRNGKPFLYWRDSHVSPHTSTNQLDAVHNKTRDEMTLTDDSLPGGPRQVTRTFTAPFASANSEEDYRTAWAFFESNGGGACN